MAAVLALAPGLGAQRAWTEVYRASSALPRIVLVHAHAEADDVVVLASDPDGDLHRFSTGPDASISQALLPPPGTSHHYFVSANGLRLARADYLPAGDHTQSRLSLFENGSRTGLAVFEGPADFLISDDGNTALAFERIFADWRRSRAAVFDGSGAPRNLPWGDFTRLQTRAIVLSARGNRVAVATRRDLRVYDATTVAGADPLFVLPFTPALALSPAGGLVARIEPGRVEFRHGLDVVRSVAVSGMPVGVEFGSETLAVVLEEDRAVVLEPDKDAAIHVETPPAGSRWTAASFRPGASPRDFVLGLAYRRSDAGSSRGGLVELSRQGGGPVARVAWPELSLAPRSGGPRVLYVRRNARPVLWTTAQVSVGSAP